MPIEKLSETTWRIPRDARPGMLVDGIVFADEKIMAALAKDEALEQVANVACLPGIRKASLAMPDIHWGYGFCIGGVCATDPAEGGVVSPGGVGYDINCGVRLLRTDLAHGDVKPHMTALMETLFATIPAGVGQGGRYHFSDAEMRRILENGPRALPGGALGEHDLEVTESGGCIEGADASVVSERAFARGRGQCGTLGAGNHFLEVQVVDQVINPAAAEALGLYKGQVCVMIHSGSRGFGHQVCEDALHELRGFQERFGYKLPDLQLACAPINSPEGERYLGSMRAAANFAWCNRQLLMAQAREAFEKVFGQSWSRLGLEMIYDVAHNIAKFERHKVEGGERELLVHRKGATRAFPAGHPEIPEIYREIGQPVLIPGDMGRASWVLIGSQGAMEQSFGTTCHGAGRALSRHAAMKHANSSEVLRDLVERGIVARSHTRKGLCEEQPAAYKDVDDVVNVVHEANLSRKVARMRPIGVIKG
ncbi:RtcB family protein [bacterium]|nr:RtcB family protein [bacterium]